MQTAKKIKDTKRLVIGPRNAPFHPANGCTSKCSTQKRQQLSPVVTSALADPLLVWTDAKLAILQSASLNLPCSTSKFFVGYQTRSSCGTN